LANQAKPVLEENSKSIGGAMEKFPVFVLLAIVAGGCSSLGGDKAPDVKVLNIDDLQKDYRASKDVARTKYDGKEFVVLGRAGEPLGEYPLKNDDGKTLYYDIAQANRAE
jgi:hypothetical protein